MAERLAVLLAGELAGHLQRPGPGLAPTFRYAEDYVRNGQVALSAQLPIHSAEHAPRKVAPYLFGLLPESEPTRSAWADRLGVGVDDAFGILAVMGRDCPGAVQFCRDKDIDELYARAAEHEPVDEAQVAARLRGLADDEASWTMPEEHWSLGGQQEKFALARLNDQWCAAHGSAATTHIFKPGIRALRHQALVEHLTMAAAARVGISVAGSSFTQFEDQWTIVVERYDRLILNGTVGRVHQEDFTQACGRMPLSKYESRGGPQLADLARVVERESTEPQDDRLALADFLAANVVLGAPDGHSKNISMLRGAGLTVVAPLYDLASGLAYDSRQVDRSVALSVGGQRVVSRIHRKQWVKAATTLKVEPERLLRRVADLADRLPAAFEAELSLLPGTVPGVADLEARLLPALRQQAADVLARL